ncbi:hypothetical protein MUN88_17110 [Gracilibacillus caseinilyticus]|uniref:Uncharacterized protein n=1 Tax=Gracilibacillus caseinilyticus TaxID=2932256 RepID=A0ABY4ETK6_9BACI|nr:hypothetical protein [Gracilibacillus caseinilyticus]UOQ47752.1 hypothetical protein MUN88_17110 [Gracilibacillus caseinilyticus]
MARFVKVKTNFTKKSNTPFPIETLDQRLEKDKVVDMRNNYHIVEHDNGYVKIIPIDSTKIFKNKG